MVRTPFDPLLLRLARHLETVVGSDNVRNVKRWATVDPTATILPNAVVFNLQRDPKAITIGAHAHIRGELAVFPVGGRIQIGEWSFVQYGSRIWSQSSVSIGSHVAIGHLVDILDSNGHPLDWQARRVDVEATLRGDFGNRPDSVTDPIVIEDDVLVAVKSTILRGVHIGRGAIVAAGSVVVKDVPPSTMVAGNPARVVRELEELPSPPVP